MTRNHARISLPAPGTVIGHRRDGRPIIAIAGAEGETSTLAERSAEVLRDLLAKRGEHAKTITDILAKAAAENNRDLSSTERSSLEAATAEKRRLDEEIETATTARIAQLEEDKRDARAAQLAAELDERTGEKDTRASGGAKVVREPRTYTKKDNLRGTTSFIQDQYRAQEKGDRDATERLLRHARECEVDGLEFRATTSSFASAVVPQYLPEAAALIARNGRPMANAMLGLPLPTEGMTVTLPRGTTGASVAGQTEANAVSNTDQVWADLVIPVRTIAGRSTISRQALERGHMVDELSYLDLAGAYHQELDRQVINGTGTGVEVRGILNTTGISNATAFAAVPSAGNIHLKTAGQIATIDSAGTVVAPVSAIVMHPRRWGFMIGQTDTSGRPVIVPEGAGPQNAGGVVVLPGAISALTPDGRDVQIVGYFQGRPVITDANIPTNVGTNNEDVIIPFNRLRGWLLEDGDGQPRELKFEQTAGRTLEVDLVVYGYIAFTAGRYPAAFGRVGGADSTATFGLVAPTF